MTGNAWLAESIGCALLLTALDTRFDPSGFILEHYVDGDLLDMREPTHHNKAAPDNLHVWGKSLLAISSRACCRLW